LLGVLLVCSMFMSLRNMFNRMKLSCMRVWMLVWTVALLHVREQWRELSFSPRRESQKLAQVFARATRPGGGLWSWATRCLAQARVTRPSEFSRKIWFALLTTSSRRGVSLLGEGRSRPGDLAQASWSRPSEMLVECHRSRPRLGEKA